MDKIVNIFLYNPLFNILIITSVIITLIMLITFFTYLFFFDK